MWFEADEVGHPSPDAHTSTPLAPHTRSTAHPSPPQHAQHANPRPTHRDPGAQQGRRLGAAELVGNLVGKRGRQAGGRLEAPKVAGWWGWGLGVGVCGRGFGVEGFGLEAEVGGRN